MGIFNAIFSKKSKNGNCHHTRIPQAAVWSGDRIDTTPQMIIEILKASNGTVIKGQVPTSSGPDHFETRVVPDGADFMAELSAVIVTLRMK